MSTFGTISQVDTSTGSTEDIIRGCLFQCPKNGNATSITMRGSMSTTNHTYACAIYDGVTNQLMAVTEEIVIPFADPFQQTFNLTTSPGLIKDRNYWLCAWCNAAGGTGTIKRTAAAGISFTQALTYGTYPAALTPVAGALDLEIYCTYSNNEQGIGQQGIKTKYPVDIGLNADQRHDGQENNLVADIDLTQHWGSL